MHRDILRFLSQYNSDVHLVNKLIVSLFIKANDIVIKNNILLKHLTIFKKDSEKKIFDELSNLFQRKKSDFDFCKFIQLLEHIIPHQDRTINGIVYTPKYIKNFIADELFGRMILLPNNSTFCDLSCGCGGFLYTIAKKVKKMVKKSYFEIFKENLFGLDIKDYSIERAKILLSLLAISEREDHDDFKFNLYKGNALDFNWYNEIPFICQRGGFDAIIGNPPYVALRNIDDESKRLLANWSVTRGGNTDLYIPFFEIGIKFLKENGILGYITVNTFFRSLNARTLRKFLQEKTLDLKIIDFSNEQIFGNRSTYTCLCFIQKRNSTHIKYTKATIEQIKTKEKLEFKKICYHSLDHLRGWLLCSESTLKKLKIIEAAGFSLGRRFKMRTGLATLSNHVYIFKPYKKDKGFYYLKTGNVVYPIEKHICKDIINPNKIKNASDITKYLEKIIFPYHTYNNKVELFEENYFKGFFPFAYKYLEAHKKILFKRDKGKINYQNWYAFGRNQSLSDKGFKLLLPHITTNPRFIFSDNIGLLFYNGRAIYSDSKEELFILKVILESDIFKFYICNSSRPYNNGYFSLSKNYIKHFGICEFSPKEKNFLLNCKSPHEINIFLQKKYNVLL